ncbi:MAG: hypothetical protein IJY04_10525 [Clostridia bacterium]|nr:hypothetical protein [Clostridia bacterium]
MFTSLDLLVVVCLVLIAMTVLSVTLMFLLRNKKAKTVLVYVASVLGLYLASVGFRIGITGVFWGQMAASFIAVALVVGAIVMVRIAKQDEKKHLVARILSSAGVFVGLLGAIFI